jgi:chromosome segregation ATPase
MSYNYQNDDMDALRVTFEDMLEDIHALQQEISILEQEHEDEMATADDAIVELYNEANELEAELDRLHEHHHQVVFDMEEDYIDLERDYNELSTQFGELFDEVNPIPDFDDDDQFEIFEVTSISFT